MTTPKPKRPVEYLPLWLQRFLESAWSPAQFVGRKDRVKPEGEEDPDEARLRELNRTFADMLKRDPWYKRLMVHVSIVMSICGFFGLVLFAAVTYLPAKHWFISCMLVLSAVTVLYWLWIGVWHNKIVQRVFKKFQERYGKFFHLH